MKYCSQKYNIFWYYSTGLLFLAFILSLGGYFSYEIYNEGNIGGFIGIILTVFALIGCIITPVILISKKCKKKSSKSDLETEFSNSFSEAFSENSMNFTV